MQHDAVDTYRWMTDAQFLNAVALGQVTPGPVVHTVAAVGYAAAGLGGGLLAAAVAFAPSFSFILLGAERFDRLRANAGVRAFLDGAGPAAIGAIAGAALPLALALSEPWQFAVLAAALLACSRRAAASSRCWSWPGARRRPRRARRRRQDLPSRTQRSKFMQPHCRQSATAWRRAWVCAMCRSSSGSLRAAMSRHWRVAEGEPSASSSWVISASVKPARCAILISATRRTAVAGHMRRPPSRCAPGSRPRCSQ